MFDLKGRVAFVTGGNGGIGLGMAKGLASAGAAVAVGGRNKTKAEKALSELKAVGAKAEFVELEVLDDGSCRRAVDKVAADFGRLDILVNNAGMSIRKQPEEYTLAEWHTVLDSNLTSALLCSQAAYPALKRSGAGFICPP